jgi:hypothetical protein
VLHKLYRLASCRRVLATYNRKKYNNGILITPFRGPFFTVHSAWRLALVAVCLVRSSGWSHNSSVCSG